MADITYGQLQRAITALHKDITRSAEQIRAYAQWINDEAQDTARVAQAIGAIGVDHATVAETHEVAKMMAGLSDAAIAYTNAADNTAKAAQAAYDQNQTSHDGIHEAARRSPVGREIYSVNRGWLAQE